MSVKDKDNEGTPTPQVTGQAASNNVADCTSPEQGRVLKTEQDDTPKDQSLQKVEEEPNSGFEQDKEVYTHSATPHPPLCIISTSIYSPFLYYPSLMVTELPLRISSMVCSRDPIVR